MRRVAWGVLGTAVIARDHTIPGMQKAENCRLYAIAGRSEEKVRQFQEQFGFEKGYVGYEKLLEDPEVEAIYLPLPNEMHWEWAIKALKKGKHVLCEKPMAVSTEQMQQMIDTANEHGVHLMEAFAYLHSPLIRAVKEELDAGTIGELRYMESAFVTEGYDLSNIRVRRETFGGSVYDLGCYNTSLILRMLEEEPETVRAVSTFTEQNIDIHTNVLMEYASGKRASFMCGMCLIPGQRIDRWSIFGTKGWIKVEEEFNSDGKLCYTVCADGKEQQKQVEVLQNYMLEVEQFGSCITEGEEPLVSHAFTLKNGRILEKILKEINY